MITSPADNSAPAIELINVTRRFVTPTGKSLTAIHDFSMAVSRGEFVAVVGPTGSVNRPRSTLLPVLPSRAPAR